MALLTAANKERLATNRILLGQDLKNLLPANEGDLKELLFELDVDSADDLIDRVLAETRPGLFLRGDRRDAQKLADMEIISRNLPPTFAGTSGISGFVVDVDELMAVEEELSSLGKLFLSEISRFSGKLLGAAYRFENSDSMAFMTHNRGHHKPLGLAGNYEVKITTREIREVFLELGTAEDNSYAGRFKKAYRDWISKWDEANASGFIQIGGWGQWCQWEQDHSYIGQMNAAIGDNGSLYLLDKFTEPGATVQMY